METYYGHIQSTTDALLVIQACLNGQLRRVKRRLTDAERQAIRPGSVFVFDESESRMKRWTDGRQWSPSRILDNFLVYREVAPKNIDEASVVMPADKNNTTKSNFSSVTRNTIGAVDSATTSSSHSSGSNRSSTTSSSGSAVASPVPTQPPQPSRPRIPSDESSSVTSARSTISFYGSAAIPLLRGGLLKKTISVVLNRVTHHLICYDRQVDDDYLSVDAAPQLLRPSTDPALVGITLSYALRFEQAFRRPISPPSASAVASWKMPTAAANMLPPAHMYGASTATATDHDATDRPLPASSLPRRITVSSLLSHDSDQTDDEPFALSLRSSIHRASQ